jgi:hypothetical protein
MSIRSTIDCTVEMLEAGPSFLSTASDGVFIARFIADAPVIRGEVWMTIADDRRLMSVAELAQLLFVSKKYVSKKLLRKHTLRPVVLRRGRKYVLREKAEAYRRKRQRIARRALRELARISQEGGLYDNTKIDR